MYSNEAKTAGLLLVFYSRKKGRRPLRAFSVHQNVPQQEDQFWTFITAGQSRRDSTKILPRSRPNICVFINLGEISMRSLRDLECDQLKDIGKNLAETAQISLR